MPIQEGVKGFSIGGRCQSLCQERISRGSQEGYYQEIPRASVRFHSMKASSKQRKEREPEGDTSKKRTKRSIKSEERGGRGIGKERDKKKTPLSHSRFGRGNKKAPHKKNCLSLKPGHAHHLNGKGGQTGGGGIGNIGLGDGGGSRLRGGGGLEGWKSDEILAHIKAERKVSEELTVRGQGNGSPSIGGGRRYPSCRQ